MLKNIKKKFTTKGVLAFILVVALLIIVADQNNKKSALQAEVEGLIDIGATIENQNRARNFLRDRILRGWMFAAVSESGKKNTGWVLNS